ncbi:type II toxin-antitoxin system RelE/ParE family toxin [Campylobacter fetus]|uniref:type II toxin-antitoxin system RelE/ParE family toxin n=1 Tax=Campylobacter fetus TaxID=196 RepID=UPI000818B31C|nr:type II toxin-antitoxin system RelE/ParE family toxin [Campylobacter fetus]OCR88042.1 hypothetical protein CFT13S00388_02415 [Campylobacter fetus subsp. testudinum]RUT51013.1 hypothetical protein BWK67_00375 [Campylobacter fetus]RUT51741.1 hypothetical protein BWK51_00375 [Campylobacter fetus]
MIIEFTENFLDSLNAILDFISKGSIDNAFKFRDELLQNIEDIKLFPYRFRKNLLLNNPDIRDLIFKKYIIVFMIKQDKIIILNIYKYNLPKL